MDYTKPTLIVISGPNGAGKSTHIQTMLPLAFEGIYSFDRDKIRVNFENQLRTQGNIGEAEIFARATKEMENKLVQAMKNAIAQRKHFVLETPLSHPDYWQYIELFENAGYQLQLNYLCLDKISDCIARVGQRVMEGGHYVAPNTIKGVYDKNLEYINEYKGTFSVIELYNGMVVPTLLACIESDTVTYAEKESMKKNWIKKGLPALYKMISAYFSKNKP